MVNRRKLRRKSFTSVSILSRGEEPDNLIETSEETCLIFRRKLNRSRGSRETVRRRIER